MVIPQYATPDVFKFCSRRIKTEAIHHVCVYTKQSLGNKSADSMNQPSYYTHRAQRVFV